MILHPTASDVARHGRAMHRRGNRGPLGRRVGGGGGGAAAYYPSQEAGAQWIYDAALGVTLSGSDVDAWADQSGRGNHLSAASAGARPAFNVSDADFNGESSVEGNGTAEWLRNLAMSLSPDPLTNITTFMALKIATNVNGRFIYTMNNVTLSFTEITVGRITSRVVTNTTTCTSNLTTAGIVEQFYDGANHSILVNGTTEGTPVAQTGTIASGLILSLFAAMTGVSNSASKVAFWGAWTGLDTAARTRIRDYLSGRFL